MKTTYVYKNKQGSKNESSGNVTEDTQGMSAKSKVLVNVYLNLKKQSTINNQTDSKDISNLEEDISDMYTKTIQESNSKKEKKKSKLPLILFIVVLIIGVLVVVMVQKRKQDLELQEQATIERGYEMLVSSIEGLYTSSDKSDVVVISAEDMGSLYGSLKDYKEMGKDTDYLYEELDTINQYIKDIVSIESLKSEDYNLRDAGYLETITEVRNNVKYLYKVDSLSTTMLGMCSEVESEYNKYESLVEEIQGISSTKEVTSELIERVNLVNHSINREELLAMLELVKYTDYHNSLLACVEELSIPIEELESEKEGLVNSKKKKDKKRVQEINDLLAPMYEELNFMNSKIAESELKLGELKGNLNSIKEQVYGFVSNE